ncbi:MAG: hypothetical protein NVSMB12_00880 [Acidimicrobiales bacterium]
MEKVGRIIGCTPGQAWTLAIGVVLAVALMVATFPPALRRDPAPPPSPSVVDRAGSESGSGAGFEHR